jgi:hypothetical protein
LKKKIHVVWFMLSPFFWSSLPFGLSFPKYLRKTVHVVWKKTYCYIYPTCDPMWL